MTYYGATFWVGANAVIRKRALEDIVEIESAAASRCKRYVQDRTVIEDTESSIDLGAHGWTLQNYPERLSYSATPPDFGSLVVQRRRWANGGLLILPKFFRQVARAQGRGEPSARRDRCCGSTTWPRSPGRASAWSSCSPTRTTAGCSARRAARRAAVLPGHGARPQAHAATSAPTSSAIYGFNLVLLPVNLAGVLKSMRAGASRAKIPFARTPKVKNRTAAPWLYVVAPWLIVAFSLFTLLA